jgi:hypothetical protein
LVQKSIRIYRDSQSEIFLVNNTKTKYIDVQYHFVRDIVEENKVFLMKVDTLKNFVGSIKKYVCTEKFFWCKGSMDIVSMDC